MIDNSQLVSQIVQNAQRVLHVVTPNQELTEPETHDVEQIKNALISLALPCAILDGSFRIDSEFRGWMYPVGPDGLSYFNRAVLDEAQSGISTYGAYNDRAIRLTRQNVAAYEIERYQGLLNSSWVQTIQNPAILKLKLARAKSRFYGTQEDFDHRLSRELTEIEWARLAQSGYGLLRQTGVTALLSKKNLLAELDEMIARPHTEDELRKFYSELSHNLLDEQEREIFFRGHEVLSVLMYSTSINMMRAVFN